MADIKDQIVNSMCMTWRHDFGLQKCTDSVCSSGMTREEREVLRRSMGKLFEHHIAPLLVQLEQAKDSAAKLEWIIEKRWRPELEKAQAEREALASLLLKFVEGESDEDESQAYRHGYVSDAEVLLAKLGGKFKEYSIVPDEALENQSAECLRLRADAGRLSAFAQKVEQIVEGNLTVVYRDYVNGHYRPGDLHDDIESLRRAVSDLAKEAQHG